MIEGEHLYTLEVTARTEDEHRDEWYRVSATDQQTARLAALERGRDDGFVECRIHQCLGPYPEQNPPEYRKPERCDGCGRALYTDVVPSADETDFRIVTLTTSEVTWKCDRCHAYTSLSRGPPESWDCPCCSATTPEHFDHCWQCLTERGATEPRTLTGALRTHAERVFNG